jgi:hypothetical protein
MTYTGMGDMAAETMRPFMAALALGMPLSTPFLS